MIRETVGGALVRDGHILLGLRATHKSFAHCWDLIGGHIEPGETPLTALRRELAEEIGISCTQARWIDTIAIPGGSPVHVFHVSAWRGEPRLANDEHSAIRWFDLKAAEALPTLAVAGYREIFSRLR